MMTRPRVRFASFEFETATGELWLDGRRVRLQRQPSRLLELLLARPGEVISREEIQLGLWGDNTHVDFERSLNFCVAKLRSALRDNAVSPRFVETVPTRGYRFIAAVVPATPPSAEVMDQAPAAAAPAPRRRWLAWITAVATVAGIIQLGAVYYRYANPAPPKIVVVPFHNETGSPDLDRVAKGVSDAAVARLATPERLARLLVIGNASNVTFSFKPANMKALGDSLGAQYLLLGQMKKDDRRLRIVAHLIRVSDQTHLWAKTYDTDTLDLAQQAAIAEEIAKSVAETLPGRSKGE
jgi:TolB-like protein/DNA-binding winged helix-turn-helix (wHTH) protein